VGAGLRLHPTFMEILADEVWPFHTPTTWDRTLVAEATDEPTANNRIVTTHYVISGPQYCTLLPVLTRQTYCSRLLTWLTCS